MFSYLDTTEFRIYYLVDAAMQQSKERMMPAKPKPEPVEHAREFSPVSLLSEWVRQGTESFFATQRILLDLVMRQNSNTFAAVRERLSGLATEPVSALTEIAAEGVSNFIAGQRVLLQLAQRQNDIVLGGVTDRVAGVPPAAAMSDLLRRGLDTFLDMQQHFLTIASKQTGVWIDSVREGRPFDGKHVAELARDAMENFVRSQKRFLDVVAEETARATGAPNGKEEHRPSAEIAELAREGAEAFIDAQKKLLDIAAQQVTLQVKVARRTINAVNPFPPMTLAGLTRQTVDSFVSAQKALLEVMANSGPVAEKRRRPPSRKPVGRKRAKAAATA
jgi:hypothetical protein